MAADVVTEPTIEQKQLVFKIVEEEIKKTKFKSIIGKINKNNSDLILKDRSVKFSGTSNLADLKKSGNWLDKIYDHLSTNRFGDYGELFHFKSVERCIEILKDKELKMFSLESQSENDYAEYSEYHHKYTRNHSIYPKDLGVSAYRNNTFIYCFTKNFRNEKFWSNYANKDSGVAIGFVFKNFVKDNINKSYYQLRDVFYDDGYALDFINEIKAKVARNAKVYVDFEPYLCLWFPYFYKRVKYEWEDEVRLAIYSGNNFDGALSDLIFKKPMINQDSYNGRMEFLANKYNPVSGSLNNGNKYIKIPLNNPLFDLEINQIICGRKVSKAQLNQLKEFAGSGIKVWKRP